VTRELWDIDALDRAERESMTPRPRFIPSGSWGEVCSFCDACKALPNRAELQLALHEGRIADVRAAGLREVKTHSVWVIWCTRHQESVLVQWTCKVSHMLLDVGAPCLRKRRRQYPEHPVKVGVRRIDLPSAWGEDEYLPSQQWQTCGVETAEIVATVTSASTSTSIGTAITPQLDQVYARVWGGTVS